METLERRVALTGVSLLAREEFLTPVSGVRSLFAADFDGDNDIDLLSASRNDDRIVWHENTDGHGGFVPRVISETADGAVAAKAADLDGDGDADVVSVSQLDGKVAWYQNLDGKGSFGGPMVLDVQEGAGSVQLVDLDFDGDIDVLWASYATVSWHENTDGNATFRRREDLFVTSPNVPVGVPGELTNFFEAVHAADLEFDGDMDFLVTKNISDGLFGERSSVTIYESAPERCESCTFVAHTFPGEVGQPAAITSGDMDDDGDIDVIVGGTWYQNSDPDDPFRWTSTRLDISGPSLVADINGDDALDLLTGATRNPVSLVVWSANIDGRGDLSESMVITSELEQPVSIVAADIDGDGDADIAVASESDHTIAWFENRDGFGEFGPSNLIARGVHPSLSGAGTPMLVDLDADGDLDALSLDVSRRVIAWNERFDDLGTYGPRQLIDVPEALTFDLKAADLNDDGLIDLVAARGTHLAWYENGGNEKFGDAIVLDTGSNVTRSVFAADIDGDDLTDLVFAGGASVRWFRNIGGGFEGTPRLATTLPQDLFVRGITGGDVDNDGDLDLVLGINTGVVVAKNTDGRGSFGDSTSVFDANVECNDPFSCQIPTLLLVDVDGDEWQDLAFSSGTELWLQLNTHAGFGPPQSIDRTKANRGHALKTLLADDRDNDGDLDIVATLSGQFDRVDFLENRLTGDANDDANVAFSDFLALSSNFGRQDATWFDGDFDNDGAVTFADFLLLSSNFGKKRSVTD